MSVYILHEYPVARHDGSKPCIMTADNALQLHQMANIIGATPDNFNCEGGNYFYIISRTQMKKAVNNGALKGDEAQEMIRFKKAFPEVKHVR